MENEALIRLDIFFAMAAAMIAWEWFAPKRAALLPRRRRWPANAGLFASNAALVRLLFPAAAVGFAAFAERNGWGLLPRLGWPSPVGIGAGLMALDLAIYLQHRLFHAVPALWRLHRVHHTDTFVDVTTGGRFHPGEILLSMDVKFAAIVAIGASPATVLAFESILNAGSLFSHGNVRIPAAVERAFRLAVVTPDMHRIHHSVRAEETDSNFGFNLSVWDRAFGTYRAKPAGDEAGLTIGLEDFRAAEEARFMRLLCQPFRAASAP
jgi:sterol desaturase/sphingolipid hydroxylase (fatty acid hydroxylase superfamily)